MNSNKTSKNTVKKGNTSPRRIRPRIKDIAELAEVSFATVARVLSGNGNYPVSDRMRKHVLEVAREHGYATDPFARYLKKQRSHIIGLCGNMAPASCLSVSSDHFNLNRRVAGIRSCPRSAEHNIMLLLRDDNDPNMETFLLRDILYLDGLIYISPQTRHKQLLHRLLKQIPIVLEESDMVEDMCSVSVDIHGAIDAATRLLVKRGCKRVALLTHHGTEYYQNITRVVAFRAAAESCGLPLDEDQIITGCLGARNASEATAALLRQSKRVDGIIAPRDTELVGVLAAIENEGLELGKDIRLISMNETETSRHMKPGISTVVFPTEQVAREAFELLLRLIEGEVQDPEHRLVPASIVERQSTTG